MHLFKKNPVFFVLIIVFVLIFFAGIYLAFSKAGDASDAQDQVAASESQLQHVLRAAPAPSLDNVQAARENVEALRAELQRIREDLQPGARLTPSTDGVRVTAAIQRYITEFQRRAASHESEAYTTATGEPASIAIPNNFAFGFEQFIDQATVPDNPAVIPVLDKQRQILTYILNQLIASDPRGIERVQREVVERRTETTQAERRGAGGRTQSSTFTINPAISARVPGAIDTLAFSVTFSGYTDTLRQFLNNLAVFDLPLVVRSVEVRRPASERATTGRTAARGTLDDIFGSVGGAANGAREPVVRTEEQKPVIEDNISTFTVTLEFIEIILPSNSEENPS